MAIKLSEIDMDVLRKITREEALRLKVIPYKIEGEYVYAHSGRNDCGAEEDMNFIYGKKPMFNRMDEEEAINTIYKLYLGDEDNVEEILFRSAIAEKASDIHFEPMEKKMIVRMRKDGKLHTTNIFTPEEHLKIISKLKLKSNLDITEKRRPQDGKLSFKFEGKNYDLRLSFTNTVFGEKLVVRILYGQVFNYALESLDFTENQLSKLKNIIRSNNGLVIFNGPTGSGKSTTMYTILQEVNNEDVNIMTIEDPVEVVIEGINQISLNRSIDLSFANALRSILRQDPDIIMIGEIRDDETASISVRASITGHKVYSTIHTKDPREVIFRLEDMGIKDYFLRDSIVGIISQRLIRTLCQKCRAFHCKVDIGGDIFDAYTKVGCNECNYTGYSGRALVAAVHEIDKEMKRKLNGIYNDDEMLTNREMADKLKELLKSGLISIEDYKTFLEVEGIEGDEEDKCIYCSEL